ncbi:glucagon b [Polypterus senegalus]|uniref:glucagon b n=1 Tax=Polypterus senegalus TaxID=55291 RepID=UPI0019643C5F|nr:glucagon b [Polypterus senegalus]
MKGFHFLAGLILLAVVQCSIQIPLGDTEDNPRLLQTSEAEPEDESREIRNVKRHSQGTFTNDYTKYQDSRRAQDFVQWLMSNKRSGVESKRDVIDTLTYPGDFNSYLQNELARKILSLLRKTKGRTDFAQESIEDEEKRRRHADGSFTSEINKLLDSIATKEFVNWIMNSKSSEAHPFMDISE